jgi:hypothetical protein
LARRIWSQGPPAPARAVGEKHSEQRQHEERRAIARWPQVLFERRIRRRKRWARI